MKIREQIINTKQNTGLKALVLSDLHIFKYEDVLKVWQSLKSLDEKNIKYDVIYLVGDILDATNPLHFDSMTTSILFDFFAYLGATAPTYIVYGSHDVAYYSSSTNKKNSPWLYDKETFKERILNKISGYTGINILENGTKTIKDGYTVTGVNPSLKYALNVPDGNNEILMKEYDRYSALTRLDETKTNTLLCHYPKAIMAMQNNLILDKVDVSVAGHNHNGITQFKFIPIEAIFNLLNQKNRGLITPGKSLKLEDTKDLRGTIKLSERNTLIINPAYKTFANCTGILEKLDGMFYQGATLIEYKEEIKRSRTKKGF